MFNYGMYPYSNYIPNGVGYNSQPIVELAKDWIHDMDIDDKILKYYYYVVK